MNDSSSPAPSAAPVKTGDRPILLVVPPFQGLKVPSLGSSLLKSNLERAGYRTEQLYLNLKFAERINFKLHEWIGASGPTLLGEFIFSHAAHEGQEGDIEKYVEEILEPTGQDWFGVKDTVGRLRGLVEQAKEFIKTTAIDEVLSRDPWLVGFSSTFQANCCSLALAQEIKRRRPDIRTMMGGANCEGEQGLELIANYPSLDFVGRGECDTTLIEMVKSLEQGETGAGKLGFIVRGSEPEAPSPPLHGPDLDESPHPDFDDYFEQLSQVSYRDEMYPGLSMETSRGCWWGAKSHCTFCAFNRDGMVFRSKEPGRAADEMKALTEKYGIDRVMLADNILDLGYFKNFVVEMLDKPVAEQFWETKANLTREQVRMMARANMRWLQPGIESLSDKTLKLMRKGATGQQNIQLLKWSAESGIRITWNWLFGFPGEDEGEVPGYAKLASAIHHLEPPSSSEVLFLERYSPYHTDADEWDLNPIRPAAAYHHVYPWSHDSLMQSAFFFEAAHFDAKKTGAAHQQLKQIVARWNAAHGRSHLLMFPRNKSLLIIDTRPDRKRVFSRYKGLERKIYEYCYKVRGERDVQRAFASDGTEEQISAILQRFVDDLLMIKSGDRHLAVATDPQLDYKSYLPKYPGGGFVAGSFLDDLAQDGRESKLRMVLTLKLPPRRVVRILRNRLGAIRNAFINKSVSVLIKLLSQPQPRLVTPEEPQEEAAAESCSDHPKTMTGA